MLQSLKLDTSNTVVKLRDKPDDPSDPGFSEMLALLAGSAQISTITPPVNTTSSIQAVDSSNVQASGNAAAPIPPSSPGNEAQAAPQISASALPEVQATSTAMLPPMAGPTEAQDSAVQAEKAGAILSKDLAESADSTIPQINTPSPSQTSTAAIPSANATAAPMVDQVLPWDLHPTPSAPETTMTAPSREEAISVLNAPEAASVQDPIAPELEIQSLALLHPVPSQHSADSESIPSNNVSSPSPIEVVSRVSDSIIPEMSASVSSLSVAATSNVQMKQSLVAKPIAVAPSVSMEPTSIVQSDEMTSTPAPQTANQKPKTGSLSLTGLPSKGASAPISIAAVTSPMDEGHQAATSMNIKGAMVREDSLHIRKETVPLPPVDELEAKAIGAGEASSLNATARPMQSPAEGELLSIGNDGAKHSRLPIGDAAILPLQSTKFQSVSANNDNPAPPRSAMVFSQMEGSIRWMLRSQEKGAELQLHPENLGRITISLQVEGTEVHAQFWASEPTTFTALQDTRVFLQHSLQQQGLSLGNFDLHTGHRGEDARSGGQSMPSIAIRETLKESKSMQDVPMASNAYLPKAYRIELFA